MTVRNERRRKFSCPWGVPTTLLLMLGGCVDEAGSTVVATPSAETIRIVVQQGAPDVRYPRSLFGVNANWVSSGFGIIENGEILRDRSFRNQSNPASAAWFAMAEDSANGEIRFFDKEGAPGGYPGYARLSQDGAGYSCVSQKIADRLRGGRRYALRLMARGEDAPAGLSVFLADAEFMPVEELDNLAIVGPDTWQAHDFTLTPAKSLSDGMLRVCIVNAGVLNVDEIRLNTVDAVPALDVRAAARMKELGVHALRWPAGTDADFFAWKESIGPLAERGEVPTAFGVFETPSFGLTEFLNLCEENRIEPLVTVNIRQSPKDAADLIEYIAGDSGTPMGALRARHGRVKPWRVTHFELGNEPSENYAEKHGRDDSALGYVELARRTAEAMRARAEELGVPIVLLGVLESTFTLADWIDAAPMLARWNARVLDQRQGLRAHVDRYKGNFYSFFQYRESERELLEYVMGGGATLVQSVDKMADRFPGVKPFWLTEYGIMVRKNHPAEIVVARLRDHLAGLSAGDILLSAIAAGFEGAYLFNLAERATWGVLRADAEFRVRPAGLAFSLLSGLADSHAMPVEVKGAGTVRLAAGDGNNPSGLTYPLVSAVAGARDGELQIVVINRGMNSTEHLQLEAPGYDLSNAHTTRLEPTETTDNNEGSEDNVVLVQQRGDASTLRIPPHSMARIMLQAH